MNAKLHWRRNGNVSPSGLCEFNFSVPVAYATGKYVSPSGLRKQAVMLGSGFTPPAGKHITKSLRYDLGSWPTGVSINGFKLCGMNPVGVLDLKMNATDSTNGDPHVGSTSLNARQRLLFQVFIGFVLIALAVAIAMFAVPSFGERMVPYYGWPVIGFFYTSALKAAIPPLFAWNPIPIQASIRSIVVTLWVVAGFGAFTTLLGFFGDDHGNPYLTVTTWQPIWTILVPLGWISVFRLAGRSLSDIE